MNSRYNGYSFPLRDSVRREKVRFHNRYGIELAGDLYLPALPEAVWPPWRWPVPSGR